MNRLTYKRILSVIPNKTVQWELAIKQSKIIERYIDELPKNIEEMNFELTNLN